MKLILVALIAGIVGTGTAVGVNALFTDEKISSADLLGFVPVMFLAAVIMCGLCYAPILYWLKRQQKSTRYFPLIAGFILNIPIFLFFLFAPFTGVFFAGLSEVSSFAIGFIVAGLVFGRGFAWYSCDKKYTGVHANVRN